MRSDGLVGENAACGELISPRYQEGVGHVLRYALIWRNMTLIENMLNGIQAGLNGINPTTGAVTTIVPCNARAGVVLTAGDVADAASFFLGDACGGLYALQYSPYLALAKTVFNFDAALQLLDIGMSWLETHTSTINSNDATAPNRLLYAARSFIVCGKFLATYDPVNSSQFISSGLTLINTVISTLQDPSGFYIEKGGHDTSYQGVSLSNGFDILVSGALPHSNQQVFAVSLLQGATWLGTLAQPNGTINSTGNSRTCGGGEVDETGAPKTVALDAVVRGLSGVAVSVIPNISSPITDTSNIFSWWAANPTANDCFIENTRAGS
jgi:hypothetical protein